MSTLEEVRRIIGRITHCDVQAISLGTKLKELRADSLDWVKIIVGVEAAFDIEVDIDKMQGFVTIEDFVSHIDSRGE